MSAICAGSDKRLWARQLSDRVPCPHCGRIIPLRGTRLARHRLPRSAR